MASSTRRKPASEPRAPKPQPPAEPVEIVDPIWLLKAGVLTLLAALLCAYLTLCLLVYQGQWQLVLHPNTSAPKTVPTSALPFQPVRFGAAESGQPRLSGWWIPAPEDSPRKALTILFLHDGSGNLGDNVAPLEALHALGVNVFAFDYRGFGASEPPHPTEQRMSEDASSALDYLVNTRHLDAKTLVPYGAGLGASLAVRLAATHPILTGVVVETPNPDVLKLAHGDTRGSLVPLGWMFHQRFEIVPELNALKTPKLLLTAGPSPVATPVDPKLLEPIFRQAATPSRIVRIDRPYRDSGRAAWSESLTRFLDEFIPTPTPTLGPSPDHP